MTKINLTNTTIGLGAIVGGAISALLNGFNVDWFAFGWIVGALPGIIMWAVTRD